MPTFRPLLKPNTSQKTTVILPTAILLAGLVSSDIARAQAPNSMKEKTSDWHYTLGAGVGYFVDYEGSDDFKVTPLPVAEISWRDIVSIGSASGPPALKVKFLKINGPTPKDRLNFTISFGYFGGRDQDDNDALQGLGDVDGGATTKFTADYQWQDFGATFSAGQDLTGDREGTTLSAGLRYGFDLGSPKTRLIFKTSATWADDNYMKNIFGITATQAASSAIGYSAFSAGSGFKDAGINASVRHFWNRNIGIAVTLGYKHLLGDAADSPIVDGQGSAAQFSALVGVSYRW